MLRSRKRRRLCSYGRVIVVEDPKCWRYDAKDKSSKDKPDCSKCNNHGWTKCKDEELLMNRINETENLMRHDGYRRGSGGIRQIRR